MLVAHIKCNEKAKEEIERIEKVKYFETEHYKTIKMFFDDLEKMTRHLIGK